MSQGARAPRQPRPGAQGAPRTRPPEKPQAHPKYWQELLGQVGGAVRRPMLELTDAEKDATRGLRDRGLKPDARRAIGGVNKT